MSGYYELANDIDMSSVSNFVPIGTGAYAFSGRFDGKNHTVSNLIIESSNFAGLFYEVYANTHISNINISNEYISSSAGNCGGLFGFASTALGNTIVIDNINIDGLYLSTTRSNAGGISGQLKSVYGSIYFNNCTVINSIIICPNNACDGGMVGLIYSGTGSVGIANSIVINCYFETGAYCGGLLGIANSFAGNISLTNCEVSKTTIVTSYKGANGAGGINGATFNGAINPTISDCTVSDCAIIGTYNVSGVGN